MGGVYTCKSTRYNRGVTYLGSLTCIRESALRGEYNNVYAPSLTSSLVPFISSFIPRIRQHVRGYISNIYLLTQ